MFKKSLVFAEDRQMTNAKGVADQIGESVARLGIFRTKLQLKDRGNTLLCLGKPMRSAGACSGWNAINVFGSRLYSKNT